MAIVVVALCASGCFSDSFRPEAHVPDGVIELSESSSEQVVVNVMNAPEADFTGHQYLLGFVPFTSLETVKLEEAFYNALYTELATAGTRVVTSGTTDAPVLNVSLQGGSCSAFDLLAIRRNKCSVNYSYEIRSAEGNLLASNRTEKVASEFHRFGFTGRLQALMERVILDAARSIASESEATL